MIVSDDKQHEATALQVALDIKTDIEGYVESRDRTALVNAKRPAVRFAEGSQPALYQRRIGQNPAVQGGVVTARLRSRNSSSMSRVSR